MNSRYAAAFLAYKSELDAKHDKYERLVKKSRDTTVQSKRVIFLLHRVSCSPEPRQLLEEGKAKLREVCQLLLRATAEELQGTDPHLFHNAFSPGLQEFIEALSYYTFLLEGRLLNLEEAQQWLIFPREEEAGEEQLAERSGGEREKGDGQLAVPLSELDYILGVADLTGELMRMCITAVGAGQEDIPFSLLPFVRAIFCGFHSLQPSCKHQMHKMGALHSNLVKIEGVCCTLKIRGLEVPSHMLGDVLELSEDQNSFPTLLDSV